MKNVILRALAGMVLLVGCASGHAATMDITASFSPSMEKPENNTFTNTTPQDGYCKASPDTCTNGVVSLWTRITLTASKGLTPQDMMRDTLFFKWPSSVRKITVTNLTGSKQEIQFRISTFSGNYVANSNSDVSNWENGYYSPRGGCSALGSMYTSETLAWIWSVPEGNSGCYNITRTERPVGAANFIREVNNLSIGYTLTTPNPLKMESGVYTGTLPLSVGPGGDIDFGDNFQASDTELTINFTLSVNHELKLTTTADNQTVSLQPCASGRICTEDEGSANWERWMVTRITPQLTGRSNFSLSSSGAFSVYLECEQQSGSDCALKSDNTPSQTVPVQTLLTLPDNIVDDSTGSTVSKRRLAVGKDVTKNVFATKNFGQNRAGSIDFLVSQKDVDTMLKTRPDTYRGAVTVIFDPNIY
ncbi:MAG: hypothetical protein H6R25_2729 [Proteobacteria bacterium]|nr:hypothetical protein [Pseudomonadota bacterium]